MYSVSGSNLILETATARLGSWFRQYRTAFLSSLLFGFLAYGFAFTNKLINHDDAHCLFLKGGTVTSGRWGLGALDIIFPNYSMPWIYGIITVVLVASAICLMVSLFSIRNKLLQALLGGTVMVFPSLIGLFAYMFTSSSFGLAFFLAVLSVKLLQKPTLLNCLAAGAAMVLSLSIYQSYISVAASLLVLVLIRKLLTGSEAGAVLKTGIFYVIFLVASLAVYWIGTQAVLKITGTVMGDYASSRITFSLSGIISGAIIAYRNFINAFQLPFHGLIATDFSRVLHLILLGMAAALLLLLCKNRKMDAARLLLLTALVTAFPLAVNCMYMITSEDSIHTLVLYSFATFYILVLMLAELSLEAELWKCVSLAAANSITVMLALIIVINTYVANQAYLHQHLRYENAYAFYTTLAADIKLQPEFDEDTKLAVVGYYHQPKFYDEHFEHIQRITGIYGFVPTSYSAEDFMDFYVGFPVPFAAPEEVEAIRESEEYADMPVYPYYGSMQFFGDVLVVKLS